ncbi:hypothetical protein DOTSEDRAFT_167615 [Dothistroma septosporum NZE10]|uniref:ER membrane protein complex subunit 7 beta-sandwich domain-containing protein n=1 Tax=Dothistroma septosporum (strain NZE10 / CBS 128990) TaxID=675120 RepID=N1PX00_DOTSN|nr:hypothetical protein DOTSEDRAFT_167615 [Dothistroma septosporum NZE10]
MFAPRRLVILVSTALSTAARLTVSIASSQLLPNPQTLPSSSHAVLLGPPGVRYDALIRRDDTFVFSDVPDASYLLTIHTRDYHFPPLRVDVEQKEGESAQTIEAWQTFRGNEWSNKGPSYGAGKEELAVAVQPLGQKDFYQTRGGFSVLSFLKSPMILMGLVSVLLIFGMPYLMENMDPEAKAEFEEMQKKSPLVGSQGAANQLQNFDLAAWMAGKKAPAAESSSDGGSARRR